MPDELGRLNPFAFPFVERVIGEDQFRGDSSKEGRRNKRGKGPPKTSEADESGEGDPDNSRIIDLRV